MGAQNQSNFTILVLVQRQKEQVRTGRIYGLDLQPTPGSIVNLRRISV
jgi:hypothetical protein